MYLCISILLIIFIFYICSFNKETYRRQKRDNIRMPWKRGSRSGLTLALNNGVRYHKLPDPNNDYYQV